MANEEHLARLKDGVDAWNQWRVEHPEIWPDLSETDLTEGPPTHGPTGPSIPRIYLTGAHYAGPHLAGVNFSGTDLTKADLTKADLTGAHLAGAHFTHTGLFEAILTGVAIGWTTFVDVDLSMVQGLDTIMHLGSPGVTGRKFMVRYQ